MDLSLVPDFPLSEKIITLNVKIAHDCNNNITMFASFLIRK